MTACEPTLPLWARKSEAAVLHKCLAAAAAPALGGVHRADGRRVSHRLLAVTGVELVKGSTLARGETGTSVGRVVDPRPVSAESTEATETAESTEPTDEATEPTATDDSNSDAQRGANATTDAPQGGSSNDEGDHDARPPVTPTPTRAPSGG